MHVDFVVFFIFYFLFLKNRDDTVKKCSWEYILDIGFDYIIMRERERESLSMKRGKWRLVNPSFDCLVYTFINMLCRIKQDVHIAKRITQKLRIYNCHIAIDV